MTDEMSAILVYIVAVNVSAFILFGVDKRKAVKGARRISEAALLSVAVAGGSIGAWCGMKVWRHKTLHGKFAYGIPAVLVLQLAVAIYAFASCGCI